MENKIKWFNHQSTFFKSLKTQREKSNYTDATLAVDGKFYPVHKLVMSTCSEYFSDIFENTPCKSPVIVLKDIPSNDIEVLLDYIYQGEVSVNQNYLASLLKTAKSLKIKGLGVQDEYQTEGSNKLISILNDIVQYSPPSKRRRHDSGTIPQKVACPIPLPQSTTTNVINNQANKSYPLPSNTEHSDAVVVNSSDIPSNQDRLTEAKIEFEDVDIDEQEIGDISKNIYNQDTHMFKIEHDLENDETDCFLEPTSLQESNPSTPNPKEDESLDAKVGLVGVKGKNVERSEGDSFENKGLDISVIEQNEEIYDAAHSTRPSQPSVTGSCHARISNMPKYTKEDLNAALAYYHSNQDLVTQRAVARQFNIPHQTLRDHLKKIADPITEMVDFGHTNLHKKLFNTAEEMILVMYVFSSAERAHPVTRRTLLQAVKAILSKEKQPRAIYVNNSDHRQWFSDLCKRFPTLTFRTPESLTQARMNVTVDSVLQWFSDVRTYLSNNTLLDILQDPRRMFNIDERGFPLCGKSKKVLAQRGVKHCFEEVSAKHKAHITVLCAVSPSELIPPPMIIYPRKRISRIINENAPEEYDHVLAHSEKGYISFETLYEYITNSFYNYLVRHNVTFPIIIFTDWHETRSNYFLAKEMNRLGIHMIGLPPNTTHFLQPLDVGNFSTMKLKYKDTARDYMFENPGQVINEDIFGQILMPIYYQAMSTENCISGFKKCGLYPWDSSAPDYSKLTAKAARHSYVDQLDVDEMEDESEEWDSCEVLPPLSRASSRGSSRATSPARAPRSSSPLSASRFKEFDVDPDDPGIPATSTAISTSFSVASTSGTQSCTTEERVEMPTFLRKSKFDVSPVFKTFR